MHLRISYRPLALALLFGVLVFAVTRAGAQQQLASLDELEKAYQKYQNTITKLENGQQPATKADHEAMDTLAKWLIYRFVSLPQPDAEKMAKYRYDFEQHFKRIVASDSLKGNKEFIKLFGPILKQRYKDLFDQDFYEYRYSIANAAPTLLLAAKMHEDTMYGYLSDLVLDHTSVKGDATPNKHDTIKLYAIRGLREYLYPLDAGSPPKLMPGLPVGVAAVEDNAVLTAAQDKRKARELQCVTALLSFIEKPGAKNVKEEEQNGARFLRRDAIETLAQARAAAVAYGKGKAQGPIAPALLRVLSPKSDLDPEPGLSEKLEAAIGVCQIKWNTVPEYQPDIGAYLVGKFTVEFLKQYNGDLVFIKAEKPRPPLMHWRFAAKRLEIALADMSANAKGYAGDVKNLEANFNGFKNDAIRVLKGVQEKGQLPVQQGEINILNNSVNKMRPASNQVFKNIKAYSINLDAPE
jgi:hypothetical protein